MNTIHYIISNAGYRVSFPIGISVVEEPVAERIYKDAYITLYCINDTLRYDNYDIQNLQGTIIDNVISIEWDAAEIDAITSENPDIYEVSGINCSALYDDRTHLHYSGYNTNAGTMVLLGDFQFDTLRVSMGM